MKIINVIKVKNKPYRVTMLIDEKDIEMFEDLAGAYVVQGMYPCCKTSKDYDKYELVPYIKKRCQQWFHELWLNCWKEPKGGKRGK